MKLTDLDPRWVGAGGEGISQPSDRPCGACHGVGCDRCHKTGKEYEPAPRREGVGISFRCPCGTHPRDDEYDTDRVYVSFNNPLDGGGRFDDSGRSFWERTGDTFETLTVAPSIQRVGGCGWHGFVTNGEIRSA